MLEAKGDKNSLAKKKPVKDKEDDSDFDDRPLRQQIMARKSFLWQERASYINSYRDISKYLLPISGRFMTMDRNRGTNRNFNSIIDNSGTRALRVLAAGLMSGVTSPARPWFKLATPNPDLMKIHEVKVWLDQCAQLMRDIFARSNMYKMLHTMYTEIGAFGTAAAIVLPDFETIVHGTILTAGQYAIAQNAKGVVDTLYREFDMTVINVVNEFGYENCSATVQARYDAGSYDSWVTIIHAIEPRPRCDCSKKDNKNMPWRSVYIELGGNNDDILRESGFPINPILCPRWDVAGGDIYGIGPGHESAGLIKQLQLEQMRKAQGIDYMTAPPLLAPSSLRKMGVNSLPGSVTYFDGQPGPNQQIHSMFDVRLDLSHLLADLKYITNNIEKTFYSDLFMMLANDERSGITAREISERHEEKMLMIGPVLERLHGELLSPLIDIVFDAALSARTSAGPLLPPAPEAIHGMQLKVEFVSILAQAQKAVGISSIERTLQMAMQMAGVKEEVLDKVDFDSILDSYADMQGMDSSLILGEDQVKAVREARKQQQQQQQQMQQMAAMATPAKDASQAVSNLAQAGQTVQQSDPNEVMRRLQGY